MKKSVSQISIAAVCAILGFLLAYQFKILKINNETGIESYNKSDIIAEIDSLKKEKEELQKKNNSLSEELKTLEEAASKEGNVGKEIKNQLDSARMQLGLIDVKGPGVTIKITPKTSSLIQLDIESAPISSNIKIGAFLTASNFSPVVFCPIACFISTAKDGKCIRVVGYPFSASS